MNRILLVGRLTRDPEMKTSSDGVSTYITFTLAIDRPQKNNNISNLNNGSVHKDADFIPVVAFGKKGDYIYERVCKGSLVSISGRLRVESYNDKNGDRRYYTDVIADELQSVSPRKLEQDVV